MLKPELVRVTHEVMRLAEAVARNHIIQGKKEFIKYDDLGNLTEANWRLYNHAESVINVKRRIATVLNKEPAVLTYLENLYGYTLNELKTDFLPLVTLANQIINSYPNITRTQVDAVDITGPELVVDKDIEDLP